ncbi:MAG: DNA recombination protein RmuC [candidate division KSB1 bacterium]|nr:DNA recombination protein RmuC [candidate division KSB1 bacterium]
MNYLIIMGAFVAGFILAMVIAFALRMIQAKSARDLAVELFQESELQRRASIDAILDQLKASFGSLSLNALSRSTEEFLKLARAKLEAERELSSKELDQKKRLIDLQLQRMTEELEGVSELMKTLEKDRAEKFGSLSHQLKATSEQTNALIETTNKLREALVSTRVRGQWGERMAEDVLRLAGFIENVNYLKQKQIAGTRSRPDFTFLLPRNLTVNMDVKFPLENYLKYLAATNELEKERFCNLFLRDVRAKIAEVATREYINPEQNTVDYVLLFIPNEQIYSFIHEHDSLILDEALKNRVVFCSPLTLYAILAVIRQAVDNFALERTSNEMLSLFGSFKKQWQEFMLRMEQLGKRIGEVQKEYENLITVRRRQLEKPLREIDDLRSQRGLEPKALETPEDSLATRGVETSRELD